MQTQLDLSHKPQSLYEAIYHLKKCINALLLNNMLYNIYGETEIQRECIVIKGPYHPGLIAIQMTLQKMKIQVEVESKHGSSIYRIDPPYKNIDLETFTRKHARYLKSTLANWRFLEHMKALCMEVLPKEHVEPDFERVYEIHPGTSATPRFHLRIVGNYTDSLKIALEAFQIIVEEKEKSKIIRGVKYFFPLLVIYPDSSFSADQLFKKRFTTFYNSYFALHDLKNQLEQLKCPSKINIETLQITIQSVPEFTSLLQKTFDKCQIVTKLQSDGVLLAFPPKSGLAQRKLIEFYKMHATTHYLDHLQGTIKLLGITVEGFHLDDKMLKIKNSNKMVLKTLQESLKDTLKAELFYNVLVIHCPTTVTHDHYQFLCNLKKEYKSQLDNTQLFFARDILKALITALCQGVWFTITSNPEESKFLFCSKKTELALFDTLLKKCDIKAICSEASLIIYPNVAILNRGFSTCFKKAYNELQQNTPIHVLARYLSDLNQDIKVRMLYGIGLGIAHRHNYVLVAIKKTLEQFGILGYVDKDVLILPEADPFRFSKEELVQLYKTCLLEAERKEEKISPYNNFFKTLQPIINELFQEKEVTFEINPKAADPQLRMTSAFVLKSSALCHALNTMGIKTESTQNDKDIILKIMPSDLEPNGIKSSLTTEYNKQLELLSVPSNASALKVWGHFSIKIHSDPLVTSSLNNTKLL